jgi:hypothetical protein
MTTKTSNTKSAPADWSKINQSKSMGCCFSSEPEEIRVPLLTKSPSPQTHPRSGSFPKIVQILQTSRRKGLISQKDFEETTVLIEQDSNSLLKRMDDSLKKGQINQHEYQKVLRRHFLEQWYAKNIQNIKAWEAPLNMHYQNRVNFEENSVVYSEDGKIVECSLDTLLILLLGPKVGYDITEQEMMIDTENILMTCSRHLVSDEILLNKLVMIHLHFGIIVSSKLADLLKVWFEHHFVFFSNELIGDLIKFIVQSDFDEEVVKDLYGRLSNESNPTIPNSEVPKHAVKFNLLDWTAVELAVRNCPCLTILETDNID